MPPKRRGGGSGGTRETRSSTRSQPTTQATGSGASAAATGENVSANRTRPNNKRTARGSTTTTRRARGAGRNTRAQDEIQDVDIYREMVAEVVGPSRNRQQQQELSDSEGRPAKRRKAVENFKSEPGPSNSKDKGKGVLREDSEERLEQSLEEDDNLNNEEDEAPTMDEDESEEEEEEEEEDWEDVDLSKPIKRFEEPPKPKTLELILDTKEKRKSGPVRRVITAVDRRIRLEIHKMHILCLLIHVYQRSRWCTNSAVKDNLRPLVNREILSLLNPNPNDQQFRRSWSFNEGLRKVSEMWKKRFRITNKGLSKPRWRDNEAIVEMLSCPPRSGDPPMRQADFQAASIALLGSRDLGAQLFCALLCSVGVTCRLVCSLQPLSFTFQDKQTLPKAAQIIADFRLSEAAARDNDREMQVDNRFGGPGPAPEGPSPGGRRGGLRRPGFREPLVTAPIPEKPPARLQAWEDPYPVYWVEAWNMATQKWVAVDPLVTSTIGKPSRLEPPMADGENSMCYVVAFEEEGQATDVTRRYVKSFNGKTRRLRVSSTKGGLEWWNRVLGVFQRGWEMDRDQLEAAELLDREVVEPVPNNIQDLKGHPLFALKRHLKRGEIIHPERKVGSITTGAGKKKVTETIYRREDVKVVKTSEQWYRVGRELKAGEQPLKYVTAHRRVKGRSDDYLDSEPEEEEGEEGGENGPRQSAMYAEFQTELYVPPSVVYGRVPKNSFGNLDIFVPSMVPKGAVHLPYKGLVKVAQLLGIDYAEAVTGFDFKNRQVAPVMNGIVVAQEYREAVMAVMTTLLDEKNEAEEHKKSIESLKRWRRYLMGLRIRERLGIYQDVKQVNKVDMGVNDRAGDGVKDAEDVDTGGGFFAEAGDQASGGGGFFAEPKVRTSGGGGFFTEADDYSSGPGGAPIASAEDSGGGFIVDNNDHGGGFIADDKNGDEGGGGFIVDDKNGDEGGGGFIVDDKNGDEGGGGFIVDDKNGDEGGGGFIVKDNDNDQGGDGPVREEGGSEEEELYEDPEEEDLGWF